MEEIVTRLDLGGFGIPVEVGRVQHELGKLWEESGETKSRASLINLVIYTEDPGAAQEATALIAEVAGEHACRAILVAAFPEAPDTRTSAWINAHCRMAGNREVCSEQITFVLEGEAARDPSEIILSHLDSDLPLCLWWQAPLRQSHQAPLWRWVDRLIFDSATWRAWREDAAGQWDILRGIGAFRGERIILGDLNWGRLLGIRFALASLFDHSQALAKLGSLDHVEITHGTGYRLTALLLLGWLASRLDWVPQNADKIFLSPSGQRILFSITESGDAPVSHCRLASGDHEFLLTRHPESLLYEATVRCPHAEEYPQIVNAGRERLPDLLIAELSRASRHQHYRKAIEKVMPWWRE